MLLLYTYKRKTVGKERTKALRLLEVVALPSKIDSLSFGDREAIGVVLKNRGP
jgi:hypothetical protein